MARSSNLSQFAKKIQNRNRKALARAITVIESTRSQDRAIAEKLLAELRPYTGNSIRIGVSGSPGVGKSTFIQALGLHLIASGSRVAVLAIDPSSSKTGGSILGDKTRMEKLSQLDEAFIRPSPARGELGGVAKRTRETILVTEAAGFDIILIETVGVGQSETTVSKLTDMLILLIAPASGDDLQGIKKGIVEHSNLIVVNKTDGDLLTAAKKTESDYKTALQLLRPADQGWKPRVIKCSALSNTGITEVLETVEQFCKHTKKSGTFNFRRSEQAATWMWDEINDNLRKKLRSDKRISKIIKQLESQVRKGKTSPADAAEKVLKSFID